MTWQDTTEKLKEILPKADYSLWIRPLQCKRYNEKIIELSGPDRFFCSWISNNYLSEIQTAVTSTGNKNAKIIFTVHESSDQQPTVTDNRNKQLRLPSIPKVISSARNLNPRHTFDEFVVGESNAIAHSACHAMAHGDTSLGQCLYINADTGLGKSHLTHAVAHHLLNFAPSTRLNYITSRQLTAEMVVSIKSNSMESFKKKYNSCDVLLMEDMQSLTGKTKTQEEVAVLLDVLLETGKTVIFTGSKKPKEIVGLDPGVRSRISSGLVTTITSPDMETRIKIIQKYSKSCSLPLAEEIIIFMAEQLKGDVRRIKSAVIGLKAKANLRRMNPDYNMVKEVLADIIDKHQSLTPEIIRDFVAGQFKISMTDIMSKSRKKEIAFPRQISMYLSRKYTEKALSDIGKAFNRDHSTVVHSVRRITESIARKSSVRGQVELLSKKLQNQYL